MSLTVAITNHDYARYLKAAYESAARYADEVLVYDDGSTDGSLELCIEMHAPVVHRCDASGSPVWGSNRSIAEAKCDHLMWLDADNIMLARPPDPIATYTFYPIRIMDDDGAFTTMWEYPNWPLTAQECMAKFRDDKGMPFPWGGVWNVKWLRKHGCQWKHWDTTQFAADFRTALDWCEKGPTLAYDPTPILAFRIHSGQWSESPERAVMQEEANAWGQE